MSRLLRARLTASFRLGVSLATLLVLGACGETITAPPLVEVSADPSALRPQDPGRLCVDYVTDDTPLICIVGQSPNGILFTPEESELACTCPVWATQ